MVGFTVFLNDLGQSFVDFSLAMLLQSTVLIVLFLVLDRCLRKRVRAGVRYGIWMLVLVKLILPTSLSLPTSPSFWLNSQVTDVLPQTSPLKNPQPKQVSVVDNKKPLPVSSRGVPVEGPPSDFIQSEAIVQSNPINPAPKPFASEESQTNSIVAEPVVLSWQALVFIIWCAVVSAALLFLLKRVLFIRALLGQCEPAPRDLEDILAQCHRRMQVRSPVTLRMMPLAGSPSVCGLFKYTILLPQNLVADLDEIHLRSIFLHELAHIRRKDLWINLVQTLLQIVYFYNPLLWIANSVIRRTREQAVDEQVLVNLAEKAGDYPQTLLHISQLAFQRPMFSLRLVGVVESRRALGQRIRTIIRRPFPTRAGIGVIGCMVMVLVAFTLLPMAKGQRSNSTSSPLSAQGKKDMRPANAQKDRIVEGFVVDPMGHPREHAYVAYEGQNFWHSKIETDQQGRFTLQGESLEHKSWLVYSQAAGRWGFFSLPEETTRAPLRVSLPYREAQLEGRVVGTDGKGLAKRKVELVLLTEKGQEFACSHKPSTDKFGNYRTSVPCGEGLQVWARLNDDADTTKSIQTQPVVLHENQSFIAMPLFVIGQEKVQPDFDRNIREDGRVHYRGRVLDERGRGLPHVKLRLRFDMPDHMSTWHKYVTTDATGYWDRPLPENHLTISMDLEHSDYYLKGIRPSLTALREGTHTLAMKPGIPLRGSVRNPQGEPLDNVLIVAREYNSMTPGPWNQIIEKGPITRTQVDGTFRIGGLPPGRRKVSVIHHEYAPTLEWVTMEPGMASLEIDLEKGRDFCGQILDSKGRPIEGVTIGIDDCRIGRDRCQFSRVSFSDAQGRFVLPHLPLEASLEIDCSKKGWKGFSMDLPEPFPDCSRLVMHHVPVWRGKVVDAKTGEPVTDFRIANGVVWREGEEEDWSRFHRPRKQSDDGSFNHTWGGYGISYPFTGKCLIKIMAPDYLPAAVRPLTLGGVADSLVIKLERGEPSKVIAGTVRTPEGKPAARAQVALVRPGEKAYIENGAFASQGFSNSAGDIHRCDQDGAFKLQPSRDEGLIVVMHKTGYARIPSASFKKGSSIDLIAWARIEGTCISTNTQMKDREIATQLLEPEPNLEEPEKPGIYWLPFRVTPSEGSFSLEYLPSIPMAIGTIQRYEFHDAVFVTPSPGKTTRIRLGRRGRSVTGRIHSKAKQELAFEDPRRVHAVAFKVDEQGKAHTESSFKWLWQDREEVYVRSQSLCRRFIPEIEPNGSFRLEALEPGSYELIVNAHDPLGENVSCGRGVLRQIGILPFTVAAGASREQKIPELYLETLTYPQVGEPVPEFKVTTEDGKTIMLSDLRGKVVLLDFWATWCKPCVKKLGPLKKLHAALALQPRFMMIGMSLDHDEVRWRRFLQSRKLPWTQVHLGSMEKSSLARKLGIGSIPTMIVIGPGGRISHITADTKGLTGIVQKVLADEGKLSAGLF